MPPQTDRQLYNAAQQFLEYYPQDNEPPYFTSQQALARIACFWSRRRLIRAMSDPNQRLAYTPAEVTVFAREVKELHERSVYALVPLMASRPYSKESNEHLTDTEIEAFFTQADATGLTRFARGVVEQAHNKRHKT